MYNNYIFILYLNVEGIAIYLKGSKISLSFEYFVLVINNSS